MYLQNSTDLIKKFVTVTEENLLVVTACNLLNFSYFNSMKGVLIY